MGFKKTVQRGIILTALDRSAINLTLSVGEVNQSVEVTTAAPVLQTESTIIGQTVNSKNSGNWRSVGSVSKFTYLARLAPGVLPAEQGARDAAGGGFSANGVRSNGQNNFLLNAVDNNVNVIDFMNQRSYVIGPSVEAIGEMRVLTNGYNPEYGRGAGGVVNVTIKSGTNAIHETLVEFLQNDKLDANQWESNRAGKDRGPFKQNQYGAAVGGPLINNRTFWFADFQGTNIRSTGGAVAGLGSTFVGTIPTPAMRSGDFSSLLGSVIGTDSLGRQVRQGQIYDITTTKAGSFRRICSRPVSWKHHSGEPLRSRFQEADGSLSESKSEPEFADSCRQLLQCRLGSDNTYQGDLRMDDKISDKDSIFGSLSCGLKKVNSTARPYRRYWMRVALRDRTKRFCRGTR